MSSDVTKKRPASRTPPSHHPSAVRSAANPPRKSQAFATFRATSRRVRTVRSRLVPGVGIDVREAPRRPVPLWSIASAGAVQRGDVLEWDEDVAVQLDVSNVLDVAVGRQRALLVFAAEERDLDLLALVLARVVLHR